MGLKFSVFSQLSAWGQEVQPQAVSERALVPRSAYIFGVQPNGVQVDPHLGFWVAPEGNVFLLEGKHCRQVWLQGPEPVGCV